jgi:peptidyl-prolyl cis-trans isomerase C
MSRLLATLLMLPIWATGTMIVEAKSSTNTVDDVIARVGDQTITFSEITTALNSSAIVGVSVPAIGTPERDTARITLLDRFVSANLLYLDALKQGTDKDPRYRRAIDRFSDAILAGQYRNKVMIGDITVSNEEIETYVHQHFPKDAELTDAMRMQIEAIIRRDKQHQRLDEARKALRDDVKVVIHTENLTIQGDADRADEVPVAEVGEETITWGEVRDKVISSGKGAVKADPMAFEDDARRDALESVIDLRIMVKKANKAQLSSDALYNRRLTEYRKTLLTNMHRESLIAKMEPDDEALKAYYAANRAQFMQPEARRLQMVLVKSRDEAEDIRDKISAGEISLYEAARDFSIADGARHNLGDVGWVNQGDLAPELDAEVFMLEPGQLSEPVESPAGWHLVKVNEVADAKYTDFTEPVTRNLTRKAWLDEKLDAYTADLRRNQFKVEVFQDRLVQLAQQEADMVKALAEKAQQPGSVTQKRVKELQEMMLAPAAEAK